MKTRKGFTLMELLVVIAIISLLLSILLPSLQKVRESARKIVCGAHMRQNLLALKMYSVENNDASIPIVKEQNSQGTEMMMPWDISLRNYFGAAKQDSSKEYVVCPADRKPRYRPTNSNYEDYLGSEALPRSYQLNGALDNGESANGNMALVNSTPLWWSKRNQKVSKTINIKRPDEVLWMIECFVGGTDDNYRGMRDARIPSTALREGCIQGSDYWGTTWWPPSVEGFPAFYGQRGVDAEVGDQHNDGANWGYIDGHIQWYRHDKNAEDLYHAYGGPVYPFSWCDTSAKKSEARNAGYVY